MKACSLTATDEDGDNFFGEIYNLPVKPKQTKSFCFKAKSMFQGAAIIGRQMCKGYKTLQKLVVLNS